MNLIRFLTSLALIFCIACSSAAIAETLTLGSVNDNVKKHLARFAPLAEELQRQLTPDGITEVDILVLPNSDAMAEALRRGDVDLYVDSPLVAARVARDGNGIPFLRRWKDGVGSYHSVILVRKDSGIESLQDLRGRRMGFQEPDSTSGFLLPAGLLRSEGIALRELMTRSSSPAADEVGYVFTGDDNNTVGWLYKGWIDAAATDPSGFAELNAAFPGEYRVLARSIDVPRHAVIRRSGMDDGLVSRLHEILTGMHESEHGRNVLQRFNDTTRFDEFPGGAAAAFQPIFELLDELSAQGIM